MIGPSPLLHRRSAPGRDNQAHVDAALQWLADHQHADGYWSATDFRAASRRSVATATGNVEFVDPGNLHSDGGREDVADIGLTGLALMAFTANGQTHREDPYRNTIRTAVLYLRKVQTNDGCFGPRDDHAFVYNHAIATTAMAEMYALSGDQVLKPIISTAVDFILTAQNPGLGWRYGVRPTFNDTSVTGWMLLALHTANLAGIEFDYYQPFAGARAWLELVTIELNGRDTTGYDAPGGNNARLRGALSYEHNPAMNAVHGTVWFFVRSSEQSDRRAADFEESIFENAPKWEHAKLDYCYWLWAAMYLQLRTEDAREGWQAENTQLQRSGKARDAWWESAAEVLTKHQRGWHELDTKAERTTAAKLAEHGSWDAVDAWSTAGGRVYATAMGALTLSMPWRFAPTTGKGTPEGK
jgi:hypothetical protein